MLQLASSACYPCQATRHMLPAGWVSDAAMKLVQGSWPQDFAVRLTACEMLQLASSGHYPCQAVHYMLAAGWMCEASMQLVQASCAGTVGSRALSPPSIGGTSELESVPMGIEVTAVVCLLGAGCKQTATSGWHWSAGSSTPARMHWEDDGTTIFAPQPPTTQMCKHMSSIHPVYHRTR